jgi:uncharacterized protein (DUF2249 family)
MDTRFKERIIKDHENMDPKNKQEFLRMLKFAPDQVLHIISDHMPNWQMNHMTTAAEPFYVDFDLDPPELLKAFQEHFAAELATITQ